MAKNFRRLEKAVRWAAVVRFMEFPSVFTGRLASGEQQSASRRPRTQ